MGGVNYGKAQLVYKKWEDEKVANKDKSAKAADAYGKLTTVPTDGSAGTRCEYPAKAADGTQKPRPLCKENKEAPLCCGSANKYLRDGTRLTVETCQTAKGTHSYKYYPKFQSGATVAPTPETWRFYCIQGANKLAATVVALGAAYYMV